LAGPSHHRNDRGWERAEAYESESKDKLCGADRVDRGRVHGWRAGFFADGEPAHSRRYWGAYSYTDGYPNHCDHGCALTDCNGSADAHAHSTNTFAHPSDSDTTTGHAHRLPLGV
jgi:hypothetical protein